jgi:hypothetical protein
MDALPHSCRSQIVDVPAAVTLGNTCPIMRLARSGGTALAIMVASEARVGKGANSK